jgi:hypothetical protein
MDATLFSLVMCSPRVRGPRREKQHVDSFTETGANPTEEKNNTRVDPLLSVGNCEV